jgi:MerR family transcriptional regulator, light-induced transcriptional regulator
MDARMRIGELSRRTGVSPELLRAWEQRYGLLRPTRSEGGYRLYSRDDEERVRRTRALIADGLSAAEAARLAAVEQEPSAGVSVADRADRADMASAPPAVARLAASLRSALDDFDAAAGHAAFDQLLAAVSIEFAITEVLIPYLRELGDRWAGGEVSVAQEHFASNLIRGRLLGLARDWGSGGSASAVLACLPGEAHDLGLIIFGLLIARRGWRVTLLGADTPFDTLEGSVRTLDPALIVLSTRDATRFRRHAESITALAERVTVAVAAPVTDDEVRATGARRLTDDIAAAADALSTR